MTSPVADLEKELACHPDRVLVLAGAGVACATDPNPCSSWSGLLRNGLQRCQERRPDLDPEHVETTKRLLEENEAQGFTQAATRIANALRRVHDGEYGRWLEDSVGALQLRDRRTIDAILSWGTRVATTNYDNLFEEASGLPPVLWRDSHQALKVLRGELRAILHLHGHYRFPDTVVLNSRTYEDICRDSGSQEVLRSVLVLRTVVFVGCGTGIDDPNIGGLLEWGRKALERYQHTHYHLVRECEHEAFSKQYQGLPITAVPYGRDYTDLGPFLEQLRERARSRATPPTPLEILAKQQTDYESQRLNLDARIDLPPLEYVRRSFELSRMLWNAGGRRTAALHMHSTLMRHRVALAAADSIALMLEAVYYLLQDDLDFHAMVLLEKAQELMPQVQLGAETHARFRQLLALCLRTRADLGTLEQVIAAALPTAPPEERARLEAERAEHQMLSVDFAQAERDVGQDGPP